MCGCALRVPSTLVAGSCSLKSIWAEVLESMMRAMTLRSSAMRWRRVTMS